MCFSFQSRQVRHIWVRWWCDSPEWTHSLWGFKDSWASHLSALLALHEPGSKKSDPLLQWSSWALLPKGHREPIWDRPSLLSLTFYFYLFIFVFLSAATYVCSTSCKQILHEPSQALVSLSFCPAVCASVSHFLKASCCSQLVVKQTDPLREQAVVFNAPTGGLFKPQ